MTTQDPGPAPLRLPAILQNPQSKTQRQVEAFNLQQREKVAARRDAARNKEEDIVGSKRGKRVVRRMNNATFLDNPHAVAPKRGDLVPSVPLHHHPLRPSFPSDAIARSEAIPAITAQRADPFAPSSQAGAFSTSLRGTRQLLRRRGRRAEVLVPIVEDAVRAWLGGEYALAGEDDVAWHVVDATPVETGAGASAGGSSSSGSGSAAGPSRRMPAQHQVRAALPGLPVTNGTVPAVLELSRSAGHITWAVPDSFDRLVVHMVARYYELVSWSEDQTTLTGETVRLTHLVRPALVKAKPPPASHALLTPETSDVSGHSASESGTEHSSTDTGDDTATEMGDHTDTEGYVHVSGAGANGDSSDTDGEGDGDRTFRSLTERFGVGHDDDDDDEEEGANTSLSSRFGTLDLDSNTDTDYRLGPGLHRTHSHGSSAYASDEGGSEAGLETSVFTLASASAADPNSPVATYAALPSLGEGAHYAPRRLGDGAGADWSDKPTFFEFVYGE